MKKSFKSLFAILAISALIATPAGACTGSGCFVNAGADAYQQNQIADHGGNGAVYFYPSSVAIGAQGWDSGASHSGGAVAGATTVKVPFIPANASATAGTAGSSQADGSGGFSMMTGSKTIDGYSSAGFGGIQGKNESWGTSGTASDAKASASLVLPVVGTAAFVNGDVNQNSGILVGSTRYDGTGSAIAGGNQKSSGSYFGADADASGKLLGTASTASHADGMTSTIGGSNAYAIQGGIPNTMKFAEAGSSVGSDTIAKANAPIALTNAQGSGSSFNATQVEGQTNPNNKAMAGSTGSYCYSNPGFGSATGQGSTTGWSQSYVGNITNGVQSGAFATQSSFAK